MDSNRKQIFIWSSLVFWVPPPPPSILPQASASPQSWPSSQLLLGVATVIIPRLQMGKLRPLVTQLVTVCSNCLVTGVVYETRSCIICTSNYRRVQNDCPVETGHWPHFCPLVPSVFWGLQTTLQHP